MGNFHNGLCLRRTLREPFCTFPIMTQWQGWLSYHFLHQHVLISCPVIGCGRRKIGAVFQSTPWQSPPLAYLWNLFLKEWCSKNWIVKLLKNLQFFYLLMVVIINGCSYLLWKLLLAARIWTEPNQKRKPWPLGYRTPGKWQLADEIAALSNMVHLVEL